MTSMNVQHGDLIDGNQRLQIPPSISPGSQGIFAQVIDGLGRVRFVVQFQIDLADFARTSFDLLQRAHLDENVTEFARLRRCRRCASCGRAGSTCFRDSDVSERRTRYRRACRPGPWKSWPATKWKPPLIRSKAAGSIPMMASKPPMGRPLRPSPGLTCGSLGRVASTILRDARRY